MKYLLDTDTCVYFLNRIPAIVNKIESVPDEELAVSCFTIAELLYGAYNSEQFDKNIERIRFIEETITVAGFDRKAEECFAIIKSELKKSGKLLEDFDILIAAVAKSNEMVLVTNNTKHFERIQGLKLENWME